MKRPLFRLNQLQKQYGQRTVLDIDQLEIEAGEILAIVGPSGAGKSTLLRLLNFLEMPSSGGLLFDDQPVSDSLPLTQRRRVTTVFQRPLLLSRSVRANLQFGLRLRGKAVEDRLIASWLDRLGLTQVATQAASQLSAGEAQRVSLARALLIDPDVLLLDEPTANLDPYNVGLIEQILVEENDRHQRTMVLVTHNIFQAKRIAHRVGLLLNGRLIEIGPTEAFFNQPQRAETAAFVRGEYPY